MLVWSAFRLLLNRPNDRVLVENQDDRNLLVGDLKVPLERVVVTRGSGVDTDYFQPVPEPIGPPVVVLASRMLWIKGIREFVESAKLLRNRTKNEIARFVLVGDTDEYSPACIPRRQLLEWQSCGIVEWWGHQQDMQEVFRQASIVCLPSLGGEGVPKVLMEAAASGRAIVTTDVPGCREIVRDGINGLIAEPGNAASLAAAIAHLLDHPASRLQMGANGREMAVKEFSEAAVIRQTLELYGELLNSRVPTVQVKGHAEGQV